MMRNYLDEMQSRADHLEADYRAAVDRLLASSLAELGTGTSVFARMRGVFPADLLQYSPDLKSALMSRESRATKPYNPELHPLNYEWYFTSETAEKVDQEFVSRHGLTICLGVPTVASAAVSRGKKLILIDQNPAILARFPELGTLPELHLMDAADAGRLALEADVLVFDSPWYLGDILAWLRTASYLVKRGGTIIFSLYPPLLRPTASLEREFVLEIASAIGDLELTEDSLAYETPLFENEALTACGLCFVGDWRRGDLVVIRNAHQVELPLPSVPRRYEVDGEWETFLLGSQVVKLRKRAQQGAIDRPSVLLEPIGETYILPSVSVRNEKRADVDVWTSRNRVASTGDINTLRKILQQVQGGAALHDALTTYRDEQYLGDENKIRRVLALEN